MDTLDSRNYKTRVLLRRMENIMIDEFSTNVKLSRCYGTWKTISKLEYKGNIAFLLESEDGYYKGETVIVDENGTILVEDGKNLKDYMKYLDDLEFYYGGSLRRR